MELEKVCFSFQPSFLSLSDQTNITHQKLSQSVHEVIEGISKQAFVYLNIDLAHPLTSTAKMDDVELETHKRDKTYDIALKILPLNESEVGPVKGCKIAFYDDSNPYSLIEESQFADQEIYYIDGMAFSILQKLVAPNFGGKNALGCIKYTTDLLGIPIMYISDGSLLSTQKCCKESSLISLKLLEIFKYGKTWYETQGAQISSNYQGVNFKIFKFINQYLEKFIDTNLYPEEYLETNYLELLKTTQEEVKAAFSHSKDYLYHLTIEKILNIFAPYKTHPVFSEIYFSVLKTMQLTNTSKEARVGELLTNLLELEKQQNSPELHQLKHFFLESVINFNYKYFLPFYIEKLTEPKNCKELFLSIVLSLAFFEQVLGYFFDLIQAYYHKVSQSTDIIVDFLCNCFIYDTKELKNLLEEKIKTKIAHVPKKAIQVWETQQADFMNSFYFKNNHNENLENIISQVFLGPADFDITFFILLLFNQLKMIKISQIESWAPSFSVKLNSIIGQTIFRPGSHENLSYFITKFKDDPVLLKKIIVTLVEYFLQSAKFLPVHYITEMDKNEDSINHFFLAKLCAFLLGPFEFKFN